MNCSICGISSKKEPLYRCSPKGATNPDWKCFNHLSDQQKATHDLNRQFLENAGLTIPWEESIND